MDPLTVGYIALPVALLLLAIRVPIAAALAINVIVAAATGADELITFHPDNASVTKVALGDGKLQLIELGRQAQTKIN